MSLSKSIVLLSGGLDSTTNFYLAHRTTEIVLSLTFDYGQRAAIKEIEAAKFFSEKFGVLHQTIKIPWIKSWNKSSLIDTHQKIPIGNEVQIDAMEQSLKTAKSVWVPNRNGIFLNIAAGFAEALGAKLVIPGFNAEEAATFPDNSAAFIESLNRSFSYSTANQVAVECFTIDQNKTSIVRSAMELNVELEKLWFCYFAGEKWCGECESCQRAKRAFYMNGLKNLDANFTQ
jgi:7-cyano-7-deazaguanine synthase